MKEIIAKRKKEMPKKLKEIMDNGGFVRWVANRQYSGSWDCFAKIIDINKKKHTIKIKCFDDGKEATLDFLIGDAFEGEITLASKEDVKKFVEDELSKQKYTLGGFDVFLERKIRKLEDEIQDLRRNSIDEKEKLKKKINETEKILQTI